MPGPHEDKLPKPGHLCFFLCLSYVFLVPHTSSIAACRLLKLTIVSGIGIGIGGMVLLSSLGVILPWAGRFYSLWDTGYAKIHIPIIASVSEHQPTPWTSFFFDLQMLVPMIPVGIWCCFQVCVYFSYPSSLLFLMSWMYMYSTGVGLISLVLLISCLIAKR